MDKKIILLGFLGGFLGGLLGIGGGSIFVPAFTMILAMEQKKAQGTSLFLIGISAFLGFIIYYKLNPMPIGLLWQIILGGLIGATLGSLFANKINNTLLQKLFSIYLFIAGIRMFIL